MPQRLLVVQVTGVERRNSSAVATTRSALAICLSATATRTAATALMKLTAVRFRAEYFRMNI
jgi:hypothetical protein